MRDRFMLKATSSLALVSVCAFSPVGVVSAQESASSGGLEIVTVTARRRDENLMQVPLAISALSSSAIEATGVRDIIELSAFTPGLTATVSGNGRVDRSSTRLTFRGLSVASGLTFIDGAPYAGSRTPEVTDAERVEVLKGPQSAYFGRSTFAGAVNFVTKEPSATFKGRVKAEATQFDGSDTSLTLEGPVADWLGVRVNARHYSFGGQWDNGVSGDKMGRERTDSISASFLSKPTDKLTIRSLLSWTRDDDNVPVMIALKGSNVAGQGELQCNLGGTAGRYWCGALPGGDDLNLRQLASVNDTVDRYVYRDLLQNARNYPVTFDPMYIPHYGFKRDVAVAHLKFDYEFDSGFSLSSTSAYHWTKTGSLNDQLYRDGRDVPNTVANAANPIIAPFRQFALLLLNEVNDFSQELRFTTPGSLPIRGTLGANYYRQWGPGNTNMGLSYSGQSSGTQTKTTISTPAVFGGVYWDALEDVTLGFEARYQWDEIEQQAKFPNAGPLLNDTFTSFSPRVTVDWKYSDASLLYALYSKGYQPGGFNTALVGQPQSILDQISTLGSNLTYEQEELDNYEAGIKTTWLDNTLRTTLAAYYSEWTNGQVSNEIFVTRPNGTLLSVSLRQNIGKIELKGIEFEAEYLIMDGFTVGATFNYADNEIKSYRFTPNGPRIRNSVDVTGNQLNSSPKTSWTLSPSYKHALTENYDWFTRLDYHGRSKIFVDPTNEAWIDGNHLFNLHAGINNDNLRVDFFVDNLFDDDTLTEAQVGSDVFFGNSATNEIRLGLQDKRTFGVGLTYDF